MTYKILRKIRINRIGKQSCLSFSVEQFKLEINLLHAPRCFLLNFIGEVVFKDVTMTRFEEEIFFLIYALNLLNFFIKEVRAYLTIIL